MKESGDAFECTDWLKLETVIETIGDMIAYHCSNQYEVLTNSSPSIKLVEEIEAEIFRLGQERQLCYDVDSNHQVIKNAYIEYGPFLRSKGRESKPVKDSLDIAIDSYNQIHGPLEGEKIIGFLTFYGGDIIPLDLFVKANGRKIRFEIKPEISDSSLLVKYLQLIVYTKDFSKR